MVFNLFVTLVALAIGVLSGVATARVSGPVVTIGVLDLVTSEV